MQLLGIRLHAYVLKESREPNFLQKLRSEHGANDHGRHERPMARPRKNIIDEGDDDEPTYVVEGKPLSKDEYDQLVQSTAPTEMPQKPHHVCLAESSGNESATAATANENAPEIPTKEQVGVIGSTNKKRLAKVITGDGEAKESHRQAISKDHQRAKAKKSKKVKLSFDEEGIPP